MTRSAPQRTAEAAGMREDVRLVLRPCLAELASQHADLVLAIHQQILQLPRATTDLPSNGRAVAQRLAVALLRGATTDPAAANPAAVVQRLGGQNQAEGFGGEHYRRVTSVLLDAVRGVYRGDWSAALSSGWVEYLLWLREQLVIGAEAERTRAGARPAPSRPDDDIDDIDDDEHDGPGYGQVMVSMTNPRRERR